MAHKSDAEFRAEFDAGTMADAAAIRADPKRLAAAQAAAPGLVTEAEQRASDARKRATALKKLAKAKTVSSGGRTTTRGTVGASKGAARL